MNTLQQYFVELGASLGVPVELVTLALLLLLGACAHLALSFFVRRLHKLAEGSVMRWDDIFMTALHTPFRLALWVFLLYLALDIFPATGGLKAVLFQAVDTSPVLLVAWFLNIVCAAALKFGACLLLVLFVTPGVVVGPRNLGDLLLLPMFRFFVCDSPRLP